MSFDAPGTQEIDPSDFYFGLIAARYNSELVDALIESTEAALLRAGARPVNIHTMRVPGSYEIPYATYMQALTGRFDALIALGVVIAGETDHHAVIADSTARAFLDVSMRTEVPVINGILTTPTLDHARERISGSHNRGEEFAHAAIEMARHKVSLVHMLDEIEESRLPGEKPDDGEDDYEEPPTKN